MLVTDTPGPHSKTSKPYGAVQNTRMHGVATSGSKDEARTQAPCSLGGSPGAQGKQAPCT